MNILEEKNRLRAEYKAKRRAISNEQKAEYDNAICKKVTELASYRYSTIILAYAHLADEIDITPIILDALTKGKKVAFPRCDTQSNTMTYHFINNLEELEAGAMGIYEPHADAPVCNIKSFENELVICFIPALLYDKDGYRLGYGKGYYDRFLQNYKGSKIGLIYSDFIIPCVPKGKYDLSADVLITEKGVKPINAN
ncbi:MAG: 5-formyltetrahydrofolate cyclo-ligase [Clostridia bacterium]|nr:5-formyltetrahydrofolate cyclo-ligase [Clostridia bacterium]